jgi:hypothetical protein
MKAFSEDWLEYIRKSIVAGALDKGLTEIQRIVDYFFCEPLNVAKVFGLSPLDQLCQRIGKIRLEQRKVKTPDRLESIEQNRPTVYLVSKLQTSGGHTAALLDVIRLSGASRSIIIITGICGHSDIKALQAQFITLPGVSFEHAPRVNRLSKLDWIQNRLLELCPSIVWLFNHHQDSVAIAAIQPEQGYRVCFYHHGDHHPCLGVYLGYAEHYDPHPMGFHNCRNTLGIKNNCYLPLVVHDQGNRPDDLKFLDNGQLVTCTAARTNKVEVPYYIRYVDVIPELLSLTRGRHIHIGKLTWLALWRIRRGLRKHGLPAGSFVYIRYVSSVWQALYQFGVDLYLASFPYGGGRTLVEVMGAGIPAVIHEHSSTRMLGGVDLAYDDVATWRTKSELFDILKTFNKESLERQSRLARTWYERYHRDAVLEKALTGLGEEAPPLKSHYHPDEFIQALQNTCVVTLHGLAYRSISRAYRNWQAWRSN